MKVYQCSWPGCYTTVEAPRSYCERHQAVAEKQKARRVADAKAARTPWDGAGRPNKELYNTSAWRKLCREVKEKQPNCIRCGSDENLEVHHIQPPRGDRSLFFDRDNLTVVCHECHLQLTAQENKRGKIV